MEEAVNLLKFYFCPLSLSQMTMKTFLSSVTNAHQLQLVPIVFCLWGYFQRQTRNHQHHHHELMNLCQYLPHRIYILVTTYTSQSCENAHL